MTKDHYVAQTFLRQFTNKEGKLFPYRKDAEQRVVGKPKPPVSFCYQPDGDQNEFFNDPRVLAKYLTPIENNWSDMVDQIESLNFDFNTRFLVSRYLAYLSSCNPSAVRTINDTLAFFVRSKGEPIVRHEYERLKSEDPELAEMISAAGPIKIETNAEYAKAMGIEKLGKLSCAFCAAEWLISVNDTDTPFVTSDNPSCFYNGPGHLYAARYVALSPRIALTILPLHSRDVPSEQEIMTATLGPVSAMTMKEEFAREMNTLVVKSSENLVLHSEKCDWLEAMVRKYKSWRLEAELRVFGGLATSQIRPRLIRNNGSS